MEIGKRAIKFLGFLVILLLLFYVSTLEFEEKDACDPPIKKIDLCGKINVQCITTPCDPVRENFENFCDAEKAGAFDISLGKCNFPEITNFEECIAAGNPAMESHPRQCRVNGETFVEVL